MEIEEIRNCIENLRKKFENSSPIIEDNSSNVIFVGDVHGDIGTIEYVKKIEKNYEKVVFLGDFVDRGEEDIEVVRSLSNFLDEKFIILAGNHDAYFDVYPKDFDIKLIKKFGRYGKEIEIIYKETFQLAPICYYNKKHKLIAMHGFIPNEEKNWNFKNWKKVKENDVSFEVLWNDPVEFSFGWRGPGSYVIETEKTEKFMKMNEINIIVRSHFPRVIGIKELKNGKIVNFGSSIFYGNRALFSLKNFNFIYY